MSKELEAVEKLYDLFKNCTLNGKPIEQDLKLIETALKRLNELENILVEFGCVDNGGLGQLRNQLKLCEKQDEVLKIIKEHIAFRGGYIYLKGIPQSGDLYNQLKEFFK